TSTLPGEQVAWFEVNFCPREGLAMRSLCAMHTAGNRVTPVGVVVPGAVRGNAERVTSVLRGARKPAALSRRAHVRLPEEQPFAGRAPAPAAAPPGRRTFRGPTRPGRLVLRPPRGSARRRRVSVRFPWVGRAG